MEDLGRRYRSIGACAVGFVVLAIGAHAIVPDHPQADAPADKIVSFFVQHHGAALASVYLDSLAVCLFVLFVLFVIGLAGSVSDRRTLATTVAVGGALSALTLTLALDATLGAAVMTAHQGAGDPVTLFRLADALNRFFAVPGALGMGALGVVLLRARVLPTGFAWTAMGLSVLRVVTGFVSVVGGTNVDEPAFLLALVWTAAVGLTLVLRPERSAQLVSAPAAVAG